MSSIPPNVVTADEILQWVDQVAQLKKLRDSEMVLRKRIFGAYFPEPKEGTNIFKLSEEDRLEGGYSYTRDIDPAALVALTPVFQEAGISVDALIERKPSLRVGVYRTLTEEQINLFDQCLIVKPASPSLKIAKIPEVKRGK